jgi:predicted dinucleotide-binding enzyme
VGFDVRLTLAQQPRSAWAEFIAGWRGLGATHLCIDTMGLGLADAGAHLNLLETSWRSPGPVYGRRAEIRGSHSRRTDVRRIGIIGSGQFGGTFARRLTACGHRVVIANSRGPASVAAMVAQLGDLAAGGTVEEAAQGAALVIVAIPFGRYRELPGDSFDGRIVVDTMNYDPYRDPPEAGLDCVSTTTGAMLAEHLRGGRIVKAFNTIYYERLLRQGRPGRPFTERLAIPIAGDDQAAKAAVSDLADELGFAAVDAGELADSRRQEYGAPVFNQPVGPVEAQRLLRMGVGHIVTSPTPNA